MGITTALTGLLPGTAFLSTLGILASLLALRFFLGVGEAATYPVAARARADMIIKKTYRTLMTRGQKACYVFCVDKETNEYFKRAINPQAEEHQPEEYGQAAEEPAIYPDN